MQQRKYWQLALLGTVIWTVIGAVLTIPLWASVRFADGTTDSFAMLRHVFRLMLIMPLGTALIIGAVLTFDRFTPGDWLEQIHEDYLSCGIVVAVLIYCVSWLAVQG